jgi:hypothetical protein
LPVEAEAVLAVQYSLSEFEDSESESEVVSDMEVADVPVDVV